MTRLPKISRRAGLFASVLTAVSLIVGPVTGVQAAEKQSVRVGALFQFSGPLAFLGQETFRGVKIAAELINEQGGINGRKIELVKADATSPSVARSEAEQLANRGLSVVIGTNSSGLAIVASQVFERQKVVFWEPGSAADAITSRGFKYTFRTVPTGADWANVFTDFAVKYLAPKIGKTQKSVRIAIKHEDGAFGNSIRRGIEKRLAFYKIKPVIVEAYSARSTDLSSLILKLRAVKADIILSADYPNDAILFARQSQELGLKTKAVVGWAGLASPTFRKQIGAYADGMMSINLPIKIDPSKLSDGARKLRKAFRDRYKKMTKRDPTPFAAVGFDGAWILFKHVLPNAGEMDADSIRKAAMALDLPMGALPLGWGVKFSGPKQFGPHLGQNMRSFVGVTQWQNGSLNLVWPRDWASSELQKP